MQKVLPFSPADGGGFTSDEKTDSLLHETNPAIVKDIQRNPKFPFFKAHLRQNSTQHTSEKKDQEHPVKDIPDQAEEGSSTHMVHITNTNHNFESSMTGLRRQFASQRQIEKDNGQDDFDVDEQQNNQIIHNSIQNSEVISLNDSEKKDGSIEDQIKQPNPGFKVLQKRKRSESQQIRKESRQSQRNLSKSTMKHSMISISRPNEEDLSSDVRQKRRKDAKNIQYLLSMTRSDFFGQSNNNSASDKSKEKQIKSKSPWHVLGVLEAVKTFIENLKNLSTFAYGFKSLNNKHLELIDDSAVIYAYPGLSNYLGTFIGGLLSKIPIFSPDSLVIIIWNLLLNIQILVQFVTIPLKICFLLEFNQSYIEIIFFYTPTVIFSMEIFVRLNISYYFEGVLIEDRTKIIQHYLFKTYYFWIDLVTTLTFLFSKDINHPLLIFVVLFRFFQFSQLAREIDEHFQISQRFPSAWNLTSLLLIILLLAHFTGCGFHYIAFIQSQQGSYTWLDKANIFEEDWKIQFLYSIYWSSITMITVGYGDIVPITSAEKIYVIIMTLISAGVFAYSINTIGSIFTEHSKKQEALKAQKHDISIYMRNRNISGQLQIETIKYLDYINQEEMEATKRGQGVIQLLSDSIKEKLQTDFYGRIIKESSIFSNYSLQFLQEITQTMKEQLYGPGELKYRSRQLDYQIAQISQTLIILVFCLTTIVCFICNYFKQKGEVGHNGFFADQPRGTSFKSLNVSQTVIINKDDFLKILLRYPQDHERFCVMKDSILQNLQKQRFNCFACGTAGHTILTCQRIHFKKNKQFTIYKSNYSQSQPREKQERKRDTKENTYSNHEHIRNTLLKLRGQKMAEISQIAFDHEGADWLREQKDKTIFQLIPRLVYENNQFALETGNSDDSIISDSSYGGIEDLLSDQESNPEQSDKQTEINADDNRMEQISVSNKIQSLNEFENQFDNQGNNQVQRKSSLLLKPSNFQSEKLQVNENKEYQRKRISLQKDVLNKSKGDNQNLTKSRMINNYSENNNEKIVQTKNKLLLLTQEQNQPQGYSKEISVNKKTPLNTHQINLEGILATPKQEIISSKRNEPLKKSKQFVSSDSDSSNGSPNPQRGQLFQILTVDQIKEDIDNEKDPKNALDIPSPLTGPSKPLHHVTLTYSTSPVKTKDSNSLNWNHKKRKSQYCSELSNCLKIDFSSQNQGETPSQQQQLKYQADDRGREFMSSAYGDSVRNTSVNGSLKQFGDYHQLSQQYQKNKLLKKNSGSFKDLMQRKQEFQAQFKNKSHEKQQKQQLYEQQQYLNGYQHMAIQKQLSRILEIPVDKLSTTPFKLSKVEATPTLTPLKTVHRQTFTGLFKNSLVEIEQQQQQSFNNLSVAFQNSKQMNSVNSIIHSPPMLMNKDFHPQMLNLPVSNMPIVKQVSQRNTKASRNSISQQQLMQIEKSPEAPNPNLNCSTQLQGKDQNNNSMDSFFCVEDMDCLKNYEIYFPGQNCAQVLKGNNAYRQKRLVQKRSNLNKKHSYISSPSQQNRKHSKFFNLVTNKFNLKKTKTCKESDFTS